MKLKHLPIFLAAAALSLTACKDDSVIGGDEPTKGGGTQNTGRSVYITAQVNFNNLSRSATDWETDGDSEGNDKGGSNSDGSYNRSDSISGPDVEEGKDGENEIRSLLLVFADENGNFITHSVAHNLEQGGKSADNNYIVSAKLKFDDLDAAYQKGGFLYKEGDNGTPDNTTKRTTMIYAFCNYTGAILEKFENISDADRKGAWRDWTGTVDEDAAWVGTKPTISNTIWSNRSFLMTNSGKNTCQFPANIEEWDAYADQSTPFDVTPNNPIKVERAAVRLDYADGSPKETADNTYEIKTHLYRASGEKKDFNLFTVELTRMSLVNMSNSFYFLRRVSSAANGYSDPVYGGVETTKNWVVDVDAAAKAAGSITPANAKNNFNFRLFADTPTGKTDSKGRDIYAYASENWYVDDVKAVLGGDKDNWSSSSSTKVNGRQYHIWRYVTENTIPSIDEQQTVQSTGIVFKGCLGAGKDITDGTAKQYISQELQIALAASSKHFVQGKDLYFDTEKGTVSDTGTESEKVVKIPAYKYPVLYGYDNMVYSGIRDMVYASHDAGQGAPIYIAVAQILKNYVLDPTDNTYKFKENVAADEKNTLDVETAKYIYDYIAAEAQGTEDELDEVTKKFGEYKLGFDDEEANFRRLAPAQGITVYLARNEQEDNPQKIGAGWGYYMYYFYWNRHNDNDKDGKMGQMEFATVRNNVYKLAVTEISGFGHPRNVENDPDPINPEDPDEEPNRYITVEVEVLPWTVRVNDIHF